MSYGSWYKNSATDLVWWLDTPDRVGEWIFSFDRVTAYNMFADYPYRLTAEQKEIFDREYPEWAEFSRIERQALRRAAESLREPL